MKPGLVGVVAQETGRYNVFSSCLTSLRLPPSSAVKWQFGHQIAASCNAIAAEMFQRNLDWLWMLGDDHTFDPDLLYRLLAHGKDIVVPLCLMRSPPYEPVIFDGFEDEATFTRKRVDLNDHPRGGVVQIHSAGSGGMLIRRRVFEALTPPWFEAKVINDVQLGEDLYFCDRVRDAGFEIFCDLDATFGHCLNGVVYPVKSSSGWTYGFSMTGGFKITMPPLVGSGRG